MGKKISFLRKLAVDKIIVVCGCMGCDNNSLMKKAHNMEKRTIN